MSNAFNNFLSNNNTNGLNFKSYAHATGLYVDNNFARAPKLGFIYYIAFNLYPGISFNIDQYWVNSDGLYDVGMLVKKIDMPKFKITTETVNQYNRKTNIQTKLNYEPVSIEFHDDNSEITNGLWKNYYKYYYTDSSYGDVPGGINAFNDTKYDQKDNVYGLNNFQDKPFFDSIDIYTLHQGKFTQMRLINPMIQSWEHDQLDQTVTKILGNKMTVVYEDVLYYQGSIVKGSNPDRFAAKYYDNTPGPLAVGRRPPKAGPIGAGDLLNSRWTPPPKPIINYPSPAPAGYNESQLNKSRMQAGPTYAMPRPLGAGTIGLTSGPRPAGFSISGLNLWYGHGGLHGRAVINAGPIRLTLKK
jgi:hypothetical protein